MTGNPKQNGRAPINVLHLTDTLDAGGAERVAVDLVNHLPRELYRAHLGTTRRDGPLAELVAADVGRLRLERTQRFDLGAIRRLAAYVRQNGIRIVHAHGSSLFIAGAVSLFAPHPAVIWHDHYGRYLANDRPVWLYRAAAQRVRGVVAVNQPLARWSRDQLRVAGDRVWYIPNFAAANGKTEAAQNLPGQPGRRIVCVANLRPQKDHFTLLKAMAVVSERAPDAHLLLVGGASDHEHAAQVRREVERRGLEGKVSLLGERNDVAAILQACDVGVLSSSSEGFPLALVEYGKAGLPVVATHVGQCPEILSDGRDGILVPPGEPSALAEGLLKLLAAPPLATELGARFRNKVQEVYSPRAVMQEICRAYEAVLGSSVAEG